MKRPPIHRSMGEPKSLYQNISSSSPPGVGEHSNDYSHDSRYSSEEHGDSQDYVDGSTFNDNSRNSSSTSNPSSPKPSSRATSPKRNHTPGPSSQEGGTQLKHDHKSQKHHESEKSGFFDPTVVTISMVILFGVAFAFFYNFWKENPDFVKKSIGNFMNGNSKQIKKKGCSFEKLKNKYPYEDDYIWNTLKFGVEDILNNEEPKGPSVYLFLRNETSITRSFLSDIASFSANCFDPDTKPIFFSKKDFDVKDHGYAITKYKNNIKEGGVLAVLVNLNEIPGNAAKALHTICDSYSPVLNVRRVVIFLSLVIDSHNKGKPLAIAEKVLREHWNKTLTKNELDPLIIRVSEHVFLSNS